MFIAKDYVKAESLQEAYDLNQKRSNTVVGGMHWLKMGEKVRMSVIDLSGLKLDKIEETEEEFRIGCMCTLRQLETNAALNAYFGDVLKECTRYIVGVQFRNGATVGGSVFGRYGFSDVLTCLMSLDTSIELFCGGIISLEEFCNKPYDRDILVRIIIKKDGRKAAYAAQRLTKTDFPVIACAVSKAGEQWHLVVGARPSKAKLVKLPVGGSCEELAEMAAEQLDYRNNMRASADYRKHLAKIYLRRLMEMLEGDEV